MPTGFLESEAGQKEFAKLQIPYPKTLDDELYDKWLDETSAEKLSQYSRKREKEVSRISRIRTGDGQEYITYHEVHYRLDKDLNLTHRYRPNVGIYPIPQAEFSVVRLDFGKEERKFREIVNLEKGYWIPFSPEKLDEIRNIGLSDKVGFNVTADNGLHVAVASYEALRNGEHDELLRFGTIPSEAQRRIWIEKEGGPARNKQLYADAKMQRDNQAAGIQERTPTVNEVRDMIDQALAASKANEKDKKDSSSKPTKRSSNKKASIISR
jgi:hypothetical protein